MGDSLADLSCKTLTLTLTVNARVFGPVRGLSIGDRDRIYVGFA